jgi:hypothetical protein
MRLLPKLAPPWNRYCSWFEQRNLAIPTVPDHAIFVANDDGAMVAGCCAYTGDGPFLHLENFSFAPGVGPHEAVEAGKFLLRVAVGVGSSLGKIPMVMTQEPAVQRTLALAGYTHHSTHTLWTHYPGKVNPEGNDSSGVQETINDSSKEGHRDSNSNVAGAKPKGKKVAICMRCKSSFIRKGQAKICDPCKEERDG